MKNRRFGAAVLSCLLLAGCGVQRTEPTTTEEAVTTGPVISYVPLDDRPDNEERVVYLAESLGYVLEMPERDDYQTQLNGQPLNENGTQYGNRGALYQWVLEQEAGGCDRYVLSMDQILSGGLVNSRAMAAHADITLPDGATLTELQALETLLETLATDANNIVWLLDSVMRLAPTVGYQHWDLEGYNTLRSYGIEGRPTLSAAELTLENVEATYPLDAAGTPLAPEDFGLDDGKVTEYLHARSRKLELSDKMLRQIQASTYGNFRVLIGIDDSSAEECIQKNEIAYLKSLLRESDALLSGVDDLAFKAVAKLYLEEHNWQGATATVRYFGGLESQPACAYDFQPLTTIMEDHFRFFGLSEVRDPFRADVQVLVLTQPADEANKTAYCEALVAQLEAYRKANQPTVLVDAGNGKYSTVFHEALTKKTELGWLLSYAGFLDMAIVTGTALSHGIARYAYLQNGQTTDAAERAFARTVADSIIKDFCYKHIVREDILAFVRGDLAGNADNFWQPQLDLSKIQTRLEAGMAAATADVVENLERSNYIVSLSPYTEQGWGGISLTNYRFPWDRAFEIGMDIQLGDFTEPHETILGIYYQ